MDMERVIQEAYDNGYLRGYEKGKADTEECTCCEYRVGDECCYSDVDIKADRPQGERIDKGRNLWGCSNCGMEIYSESERDRNEFHKWCSRCGARMKGADDE